MTPVHSLADCLAALAAGEVELRTAPGAARALGPLYLAAMWEAASAEYPGAAAHLVVDCGDDAGLAMACLRAGLTRLAFAGREDVREKLAGMGAMVSR